MGMRLMGEVLRRSGAFYIGRGIRADKLYWAVLSEYVHTIVRVCVFDCLSTLSQESWLIIVKGYDKHYLYV